MRNWKHNALIHHDTANHWIATSARNEITEEKILASLRFVADFSGSADYLYDVFFTQERVILLRLGRKSLCRVAVGMAGALNIDEEPSILHVPAGALKNLVSIPYQEILRVRLSLDSQPKKTLELDFSKRPSLRFLLDKNQFNSVKYALRRITGLQNRLNCSL